MFAQAEQIVPNNIVDKFKFNIRVDQLFYRESTCILLRELETGSVCVHTLHEHMFRLGISKALISHLHATKSDHPNGYIYINLPNRCPRPRCKYYSALYGFTSDKCCLYCFRMPLSICMTPHTAIAVHLCTS